MPNYVINNDIIRIIPDAAINIETKLPLGTYTVEIINSMTGELGLKRTVDFAKPAKVYGEADRQADRIISTFEQREVNTGVMLGGEKGSGKTFLAKYISWKILQKGYSTIMVNAQFNTIVLSELIRTIAEPCLIIFDEFEKIYSKDSEKEMKDPQNGLLTLLDGLLITKKLFVFTCNECERVTTMMKNRPGRIFYNLEFGGLTDETIQEYCNENLYDKVHTKGICGMKRLFGRFTFDMLKALVEEVNRYKESPLEAVKMMNIIPEFSKENYTVQVVDMETGETYRNYFEHDDNPLWANIFAVKVAKLDIWKEPKVKPRINKAGKSIEPRPAVDEDVIHKTYIRVGVKDLVTQNENDTIYIVDKKYRVTLTQADALNLGRKLWQYADPYAGL